MKIEITGQNIMSISATHNKQNISMPAEAWWANQQTKNKATLDPALHKVQHNTKNMNEKAKASHSYMLKINAVISKCLHCFCTVR